jgi:hypothetical protein
MKQYRDFNYLCICYTIYSKSHLTKISGIRTQKFNTTERRMSHRIAEWYRFLKVT